MMAGKFGIRSKRIRTNNHDDEVIDGLVLIENGLITDIVTGQIADIHDRPILDIGTKPVMPGFVDPHVHVEMSASALWETVDCHTPPVQSIDDVIQALLGSAELRHSRGGWLVGQGGLFAERRLAERRLPTRHDLDRVSTSFPIAIRFGGHVTALNSLGLELSIGSGLPITGDAHVELDEYNQPNGILHELFYALPIPQLSPDEVRSSMQSIVRDRLVARGVTTIGEISNTRFGIRVLAEGAGSPQMPIRVKCFAWIPGTYSHDELFGQRLHREDIAAKNNSHFALRGVKVFVDGGYSAGGAAVLRPYRTARDGEEYFGRMAFTHEELVALVRSCAESGLQLAAHVNGEAAQRALCGAAIEAGNSGGELPVRLEHGGNVITDFETLDYWQRAGAIPVAQAAMLWPLGSFLREQLGDYVLPGLFPFKSILARGWDLASSSDATGSEPAMFNPMFGVEAAVGRTSCIGETINVSEAITTAQALRMHTINSAKALDMENEVGSLERGKRADLIVMSEDPTDVSIEKLQSVRVEGTCIGGDWAHWDMDGSPDPMTWHTGPRVSTTETEQP